MYIYYINLFAAFFVRLEIVSERTMKAQKALSGCSIPWRCDKLTSSLSVDILQSTQSLLSLC